jgi:hypothetical protein
MGKHPPDFAATKAKPQLAPYHFRSVLPRHFKDCPSFGTAHGVPVKRFSFHSHANPSSSLGIRD